MISLHWPIAHPVRRLGLLHFILTITFTATMMQLFGRPSHVAGYQALQNIKRVPSRLWASHRYSFRGTSYWTKPFPYVSHLIGHKNSKFMTVRLSHSEGISDKSNGKAIPIDSVEPLLDIKDTTPKPLVDHISCLIRFALDTWELSENGDIKNGIELAVEMLVRQLIDDTANNIRPDDTGNKISRREWNRLVSENGHTLALAIASYKQKDPSVTIQDILKKQINCEQLVDSYKQYLDRNRNIYEDITSHHHDLKISNDWKASDESLSSEALAKYAKAAEDMGNKLWVRQGNEWMLSYAFNYYLRNGAKRSYINEIVDRLPSEPELIQKLNIPLTADQYQRDSQSVASSNELQKSSSVTDLRRIVSRSIGDKLPSNLMETVDKRHKIRLLDVGSCYNPFISMENADMFDITAIDLYPRHDSVYRCDFLNMTIGSNETAPILVSKSAERQDEASPAMEEDSDPYASFNQIVQLPEGSFDVVTMSLVLSYLPNPDLRLQMIQKARRLLVSPGHRGHPHHTGKVTIAFSQVLKYHIMGNADST